MHNVRPEPFFLLAWLVLAVGCIDGAPMTGESSAALTPVTWTDVVGASAVGNDLSKTAPEASWNAGAVSVETITGDGYVEFTTGEATTAKMAGLSNGNGGPGDADIDFAIRLGDGGGVVVFEGGVSRGVFGSYVAGDVFRVQVVGGVVTYWQNGELLYTSAGTPTFPLLVDTSLRTPGATVSDVAIQSLAFWEQVVGASASGNDLTKTSPETTWQAGAVSAASLSGDGFVRFTTGENTTAKMAGLSSGNGNQGYADIDFGIMLNAAGTVSIREAGVLVGGFGTYDAGDVFRVQAEGGVVSYWRNGVLLHTSTGTPTFPLLVDTSLKTPGATIKDVRITSLHFWQNFVLAGAVGNDLTKTSSIDTFNAGASSIASIESGDGHVQFTAGDATTSRAAGLSSGDSGPGRGDIDYAISLSLLGRVDLYEGGVLVDSPGPYDAGDVFQVRVVGGVVSYWQNGVELYTSSVPPTYPLLLDTSLRTPGATILDAAIGSGSPPDCSLLEQTLLGSAPSENFGRFEISGDVLAVADLDLDTTVATIYRRSAGLWVFEQDLTVASPVTPWQLATDGTTIVIAATPQGADQRIGQIFRHDGAAWALETEVLPCPEDDDGIESVAVDGDVAVLGVEQSTVDGHNGGHVYVHRRTGGSWLLEAILTHDDPLPTWRNIGRNVAVAGDWLVASSPFEVHVFRHRATLPDPPEPPSCSSLEPGKWRFKTTLLPEPDNPILTGLTINPSGTRVLAADTVRDKGYLFDRVGSVWSHTLLEPRPPGEHISVGSASLGGPGASSIASVGRFVFADQGGFWTQIAVLPPGWNRVTAVSVLSGDSLDDTAGTDAGAIREYGLEPVCLAE